MKSLLLVSNSQCHGHGYLDHAEGAVRSLFEALGAGDRVAFIPFALDDHAAYGERAVGRLGEFGLEAEVVFPGAGGKELIENAAGFFVGGGNTFRLLSLLRQEGLIEILRDRVEAGIPYMGSSAGSGIAAPTLKTSNDMPIVDPMGFEALGLVDYQLNLHYLDADPDSTHMGETRELRLREYLEMNVTPVVALREGAWIEVRGVEHRVGGETGGLIFRRGAEPVEIQAGDRLRPDGGGLVGSD